MFEIEAKDREGTREDNKYGRPDRRQGQSFIWAKEVDRRKEGSDRRQAKNAVYKSYDEWDIAQMKAWRGSGDINDDGNPNHDGKKWLLPG